MDLPETQQSHLKIPSLVYGTAWKQESTANLVYEALSTGFTALDTAGQPRHYREDLVGEALRRAISDKRVDRASIFVQTKFSPASRNDPHAIPFDPQASIPNQIEASVTSSLNNLRIMSAEAAYIDCLLLHCPLATLEQILEAWTALEGFVPHKIKHLGVSNFTLPQLKLLYNAVRIKPSVIQNRFYPDTNYDSNLRKFAQENGIHYQAYWILKKNPDLLISKPVVLLATKADISCNVALYLLILALGRTSVLDGTTNSARMSQDLQELRRGQAWAEGASNRQQWSTILLQFESIVGNNVVR